MHLDESLNARSIASLQTIQFVWAPATARSTSKSELLRLLRRHMLSPERVRELFDSLTAAQQEILRGLLRCEGYTADVDLLVRRLASAQFGPRVGAEAIDDLARQGFLRCTKESVGSARIAQCACLPEELGDALAEVLNLDFRDPALMLSLERHLGHEHAAAGDAQESLAGLAEPAAIEQRIAALPDGHLQRAVQTAFEQPAGILPLERFPAHGLDIEAVDPAAWRGALERHRLGTFGHLDLDPYAIGDDHDCLVLYQEIVQSHAAAQARADYPIDHTYACGMDLITDLSTVVDFLRARPSKLTGAGRLFKGARNQLLPRTGCHTTFFMDEDIFLAFKVQLARRLQLLEVRSDERLHASRAAAQWQARPLAEQARSVLTVLLEIGVAALPRHFRSLADAALELLFELPHEAWMPTDAFLSTVISHHLSDLLAHGDAALDPLPDEQDGPWRGFPPRPATVEGIASVAAEPLLRTLNYIGLVDIGRAGERSFLRATPLVPFLLADAKAPTPPPNSLLIVNPDGEVILFPEGHHMELLHELCGFCDREKSDLTAHLRLCQESIHRASLRGIDPESIIATLRRHCRVPLSQNIEYSIRNWAASVHPAEIETLHVLEFPSPELLDAAVQLPEIAPLVLRRISSTAVALSVSELAPEAQDALARLGVYLT